MSTIDNTKLMSIINRLENINEDITALTEDKKAIMAEAKGSGFDTKAIAHVIKKRKMDKAKRDEMDALYATYEAAAGL